LRTNAEDILVDMVLLKSTSEDSMKPIVDYVSERLRRIGLEPRLLGDKQHPAIVARNRRGGVMLSGHLDTVPRGDGWSHEDGELVGGVVYGRGACDMKAGCAAMIMAAEDLVAANIPFSLCFTTDEETTMDGAAAVAKNPIAAGASAIVIAEATGFDIVVKEKGLLHFALRTEGVSAHASMPQLGDNAISRMTRLLSRLEDLQRIPKDPLNQMTLCVNTIRGGTRINVIPSECEAEIDVRYPPSMNTRSVLKMVRGRIGTRDYELKILHELDPVETNPRSRAVTELKKAVGPRARVTSVPYATEMVMFKRSNPNVMVCGPGDPKGCHVADERIEVDQVMMATELFIEYCSSMSLK
jgi:acetylornithine deacetylase/succinyl-diaminopimelate desuccinylase-like protein